ncbi:MAG: S53 family serine peptidase [Steroidobacteraceae bacterium]
MRLHTCLLTAACAVGFLGNAAAVPYPRSNMPPAVDLGLIQNVAPGTEVTLTVALKLRNSEQMQSLLQSIYTPGSANYRHFLTSQQFAAQFGPTSDTITQLTRHFQADGFTVTRSATAQLQITGSVQAVQAEFGVNLHEYQVASTVETPAFRFRGADGPARLSADIAGSVETVAGLNTRPIFHPNILRPTQLGAGQVSAPLMTQAAPTTSDPPGQWTVVDFGEYYDVDPLYDSGISGRGRTIGIVTFASFTPSDAFAYWNSLGLKVNPNRISQVLVDGGSGPISDAGGSDETTLDVEQSGGIAPGANVVVYEAPNTSQGFIDDFAKVVDQNVADTWSVSWGEWEWLDIIPVDDVVDPTTGRTETTLQALNDVLVQAALEGQSVFCAAGDAGAYDANDPALGLFVLPFFSKTLSVDDPAAQQFITVGGGTTLPGKQTYSLPNGSTISINVPRERAWGWDYLEPLCNALGQDPVSCGIFPVGGGGGVSSYVPLPLYQWFTPGVTTTPRDQKLVELSPPPFTEPPGINLPVKLPGGYHGRNVPDISVNSDPQTGYVIFYTSSVSGFGEFTAGGTSFAAPQLNGVTSLLNQAMHRRVGLLNFALYAMVDSNRAYAGPEAPLRDIKSGDNWFWNATPGYDQATGVGVPNVANLLQTMERPLF